MAKMYYNEEEAAAKLGCSVAALENYVNNQKLRVYRDGTKRMFKATEVDALAAQSGEEIELAPADTGEGLKLSETDVPKKPGKEDTVITAAGISIFDDEDLEIEAADPMAKTHIAPAMEDQVAIESAGSGSGLLDLTRESDDTSLGAEVLDHIDMEGVVGSSLVGEEVSATPAYAPAVAAQPVYLEAIDASAGAFGGLLTGMAAVMLMISMIVLALLAGQVPDFLEGMAANTPAVLAVVAVVLCIGAIVGYFAGKNAAQRQAAMRRVG